MLQITIEYDPQTGSFRVGWPPVDAVAQLGMLEMAKTILIAGQIKQKESGLVIPKMA